jgi:hypothetical protein
VKKIICPLRIEVEKIHACKNSCVLFYGDYADLDKCPKCGYDRYKRKKDGGDDNNVDDENEPGKIRGKKKKANRGAPVRVAWWKWNPFCNIKDAMYRCNFNFFCNIWDAVEFESCLSILPKILYILFQFSNGQEKRTNEPTSLLSRARDED